MSPLLSVHLSVDYRNKPGILRDVAFDILPGEVFGLVGASGSGKSTLALAILRLLDMRGGAARGSVVFEGRDLLTCKEKEMRQLRGRRIGLVPQSPASALNPALGLETHLREAWQAHAAQPWKEARDSVLQLLCRLELPADDAFLRRYPHQVSVGQAQRVLIAMAVLHRPALLIADEPTSALDPTAQSEILSLLRGLNRDFAMAALYISHDLASVDAFCHRVGRLTVAGLTTCSAGGYGEKQGPDTPRLAAWSDAALDQHGEGGFAALHRTVERVPLDWDAAGPADQLQ